MNPNNNTSALLSENDIQDAILEGSLKIFPFDVSNLTGIGYNLGTTDFFLSIRKGTLEKVHENKIGRYVRIAPNDTVLTFTYEYIEAAACIAGTFHSKVSRVCQGLGHISTTLDPNWKGQLIISINNPTGKTINLYIDKPNHNGNIITMLIYRLSSPIADGHLGHDNNEGRGDMLMRHFRQYPFAALFKRRWDRLCDFIFNKFISSLNGNDGFIDISDSKDTETYNLATIKSKLIEDLDMITLGTFSIRPGGTYFPVTPAQIAMIKRCVLFKIMLSRGAADGLLDALGKGFHTKVITDISLAQHEIQPFIQQLIDIVDYELATINHKRRIKMQNESIVEFYKTPNTMQKIRGLSCFLLAVALVAIQIYSLFTLWSDKTTDIVAALITAYATIDIFIATVFYNIWR